VREQLLEARFGLGAGLHGAQHLADGERVAAVVRDAHRVGAFGGAVQRALGVGAVERARARRAQSSVST
jgi:hypothetical protein